MDDFDKRWKKAERQRRTMGRIVAVIMALTGVLIVAGFGLGVWLLANPEAAGEYIGRLVDGYEDTRK